MLESERETPSPLAPLLMCFLLLPPGLPYVNWASQACCSFYLRSSDLLSSTQVLRLSFVPFSRAPLSFSHRHSGLLFPILTT